MAYGLTAVSFGITTMYRGVLAGLFVLALSICPGVIAKPNRWPLAAFCCWPWLQLVTVLFCGRSVGGIKLAPVVSPNKTVSGSVGGILSAVAVMAGLASIPALAPIAGLGPITGLDVSVALFLGCGVAVLSQIGDLLESALKRRLNVKDSGSILPGHGGLLDRFDGYLFTVPAYYLFFFEI